MVKFSIDRLRIQNSYRASMREQKPSILTIKHKQHFFLHYGSHYASAQSCRLQTYLICPQSYGN